MQVHLALIYGAMFIAQLEGEAWWQGTALWWIMARPDSRLVDFTGVSNSGNLTFEYLINFGTHAILVFEIGFALLIWNSLARPIFLVVGCHLLGWHGLDKRLDQLLCADALCQSGLPFSHYGPPLDRPRIRRPAHRTGTCHGLIDFQSPKLVLVSS